MSEERNYIITDSGELFHYGVPGMKWGKRKNATELPIGQNYTTPANESSSGSGGGGGGGAPEEEEDELDLLELAKKGDRLIETAKYWLNDNMSNRVVDVIAGKAHKTTWEDAKRWINYIHRGNDDYPKWK